MPVSKEKINSVGSQLKDANIPADVVKNIINGLSANINLLNDKALGVLARGLEKLSAFRKVFLKAP